jgi:hypothetical protein
MDFAFSDVVAQKIDGHGEPQKTQAQRAYGFLNMSAPQRLFLGAAQQSCSRFRIFLCEALALRHRNKLDRFIVISLPTHF